jgi:hypothetical protein
MTTRTSRATVTFQRSFMLTGMKEEQPAGDYVVETDEELLDGVSFPAYRRVKVLLHLQKRPGHPDLTETVWIEPAELDAALDRDAA